MAKRSVAQFTPVRRSLWNSERFCGLRTDKERFLYLYYLTCPHQTASGCFVCKDAYTVADLGEMNGSDWTMETVRQGKQALEAAELILADDATGEILITNWWKDNPPRNESWFAGAQKQCDAIRSGTLRVAAQEALEECHRAFMAAQYPKPPTRPNGSSPISLSERAAALNGRRAGH